MKIHKSITLDRVMAATESGMFSLENPGFCTSCGEDAAGCEPDACDDTCEYCDEPTVYGAQELLLEMVA